VRYTVGEIGEILGPSGMGGDPGGIISEVSIDSRSIVRPAEALFFALPGEMSDGHRYVGHAYRLGVRNFVVKESGLEGKFSEANFFVVEDVLQALQKLATHHRKSYPGLKTIGITGSNGKTIIKEWLYQMLHDIFRTVKSPKSYNSQKQEFPEKVKWKVIWICSIQA